MKSIVIYYSQSGNTKLIALAIQKGIAGRTGQCDIARLKEIHPEKLVNYDLVGIGSPVWTSAPTPNVMDYIKSMPSSLKGKHVFYYCTHGALPGLCISRGVRALQQQGLTVVGWNDWYGGASLQGHPKPYLTDGHPDAIDLAEAEAFGSEIAENSIKISRGADGLIPALPEGKAYDEIYGIGHPEIQAAMKAAIEADGFKMELNGELRINKEKCTGCMLCADNCFSNNIDSSVSPPVFKNQPCFMCFYCESLCPAGAIEFDFPLPESNFGAIRVFQRMLAEAETKGRFRKLVADKDIGWQTPWEKVSQHPRLRVQ